MAILFQNVTAVTMDPARPELKNAFVAVEGTKIASVGSLSGSSTALARC